jgi:hypothetical protein
MPEIGIFAAPKSFLVVPNKRPLWVFGRLDQRQDFLGFGRKSTTNAEPNELI